MRAPGPRTGRLAPCVAGRRSPHLSRPPAAGPAPEGLGVVDAYSWPEARPVAPCLAGHRSAPGRSRRRSFCVLVAVPGWQLLARPSSRPRHPARPSGASRSIRTTLVGQDVHPPAPPAPQGRSKLCSRGPDKSGDPGTGAKAPIRIPFHVERIRQPLQHLVLQVAPAVGVTTRARPALVIHPVAGPSRLP